MEQYWPSIINIGDEPCLIDNIVHTCATEQQPTQVSFAQYRAARAVTISATWPEDKCFADPHALAEHRQGHRGFFPMSLALPEHLKS